MDFQRLFVAAIFALVGAFGTAAGDGPYRFSGAERVVAFGDVHGAYDELVQLLGEVGVIDADGRWNGGRTHLVSTGDLLHRGDHGRQVLDLLMRLEHEAQAAGGRVHVTLGNHEVMSLTRDLRYVSEGDFQAFGGRAARRDAFLPDGDYGQWLLSKPLMVVVNDTAFVHGGLSASFAGRSLEQVNQDGRRDLLAAVEWLAERPDADFDALRANTELAGLPFHPDGPLWYRGTSLCHPYIETATVDAALAGLGARRVAIGHTVTADRRITSRMDGRVLRLDTGMNNAVYGGHAAALVFEGDAVQAHYRGAGSAQVVEEPNRVWPRPYGMSDPEIEAFLREAVVVGDEEIGTGVTRPRRVTLERDGRRLRAAFKTVDTDPRLPQRRWQRSFDFADRDVYEVAAYRLDRLLGLEMLPVAVERTIGDEAGVLVLWLENTISENERRERGVRFGGHCDMVAQAALVNTFHVLVHNVDPNLGNLLYDQDTWQLWAIDHSRAFGTQRGIPRMIRGANLVSSPSLDRALERVTRDNLKELEPYLHRNQLQALEQRAVMLRRR